MSNCTDCAHSFGDEPNPNEEVCEICIRNPKYPSKKMPEKATIDGIILSVPQDMYISKDRQTFEQKRFMQQLAKMLKSITQGQRREPKLPDNKGWKYPIQPWDWYWDWKKHRESWIECKKEKVV